MSGDARTRYGVSPRRVEKLWGWLQGNLQDRDVILVKGSRGIQMERFIERLKQGVA